MAPPDRHHTVASTAGVTGVGVVSGCRALSAGRPSDDARRPSCAPLSVGPRAAPGLRFRGRTAASAQATTTLCALSPGNKDNKEPARRELPLAFPPACVHCSHFVGPPLVTCFGHPSALPARCARERANYGPADVPVIGTPPRDCPCKSENEHSPALPVTTPLVCLQSLSVSASRLAFLDVVSGKAVTIGVDDKGGCFPLILAHPGVLPGGLRVVTARCQSIP